MSSGKADLQTAVLETTWGDISIAAGSRGVGACRLPLVAVPPVAFRLLRVRLSRGAGPVLRQAVTYVQALLAGRAPGKPPALDQAVFADATEFRRAIWKALQKLPRGRVATYAELARQAGHPGAARAAGGACGANPLPLFVPCHRAVAANGGLGGFSAGLAWKVWLLAGEGVRR